MDLEHERRLTEVEGRAKSNTHRLDNLDSLVDVIHNISKVLVELTAEIKHTNENVDEIKNKVEAIEKEPAEAHKQIKKSIVTAIISAVVGAAVGALLAI